MNPWFINDDEFLAWLRDLGVEIAAISEAEADAWYSTFCEDDEYWYDDYS